MLPGQYLEKRRLMAGYSLTSLARELLLLTGFGTSRADSDFRRLRLTLTSAEQGSLHHSRERIELIRAFVPLDVSLYLHLVDCERSGDPFRVDGLCQNCACSFHDPCVLHVGPTAELGTTVCSDTDTNLCSACLGLQVRVTPPRIMSLTEQLRELGDRMQRISREEDRRHAASQPEQPFLRVVPANGEL